MNNKKLHWPILFIFCLILVALYLNSMTRFRLKIADLYIRIKSYDKAIATYKKILRKETLSSRYQTLDIKSISDIHFTLANLLLTQNRFIESAQILKQMTEINAAYKIDSFPDMFNAEDHKRFGFCLLSVNLRDLAIKQFQRTAELQPDDPLTYYQLALIYQKQGMQDEAIRQFNKAIELANESINQSTDNWSACLANIYYNLALSLERNGDTEKAGDYYEKAIELDGNRIIEAYYRLSSLYAKQGKFEDIEHIETKLLNLKPEYTVNHKFSTDLTLLGYSLDGKEFELFNEGKITFFWEVSSQNSELSYEDRKSSNIYKIGNRLYEIKEVENLASNFGFELDSIGEGFPYDWETDIYGASFENHEIVFESMPIGKSKCLLLNNAMVQRTNCQTDYIAIGKNSLYLQAAWVKSISGNALLGRRWFDSKKKGIMHNFATEDIKLPTWKYYSQVIIPPPDSAYCRLWLINYGTQGKAYFDDIIFIRLQPPTEI